MYVLPLTSPLFVILSTNLSNESLTHSEGRLGVILNSGTFPNVSSGM